MFKRPINFLSYAQFCTFDEAVALQEGFEEEEYEDDPLELVKNEDFQNSDILKFDLKFFHKTFSLNYIYMHKSAY